MNRTHGWERSDIWPTEVLLPSNRVTFSIRVEPMMPYECVTLYIVKHDEPRKQH